jgi:MarR family 2-MHQ and catechol resistance regulon transcriptional repressor
MGIDNHIKAKFKDDHHKAIVNLRFTSNWIGAYYNQQLQQFNLTLPQFNILRILRGAGEGISVQTVKERMLEPSPNTTRLIDKLYEKGFVRRNQSDFDKRVRNLEITESGMLILSKVDYVFDEMSLKNNLTKEEAQQLNKLLDKLRNEN